MLRWPLIYVGLWTGIALGQTRVDLAAQSRNIDFSSATTTRPFKVGTDLPAGCAVGEVFFSTVAPAGYNLFACPSPNTWTLESGWGLAGTLTPLTVSRTSTDTLTVGENCTTVTPCLVRFGSTVLEFTQSATVTRNSGTGTAFIYVTATGSIVVGHSFTVTCTGCVAQSGVTAFPGDSLPLFNWVALETGWDTQGANAQAFLSTKVVNAGLGLMSSESGGTTTLGVAAGLVPLRVSVPSTGTDSCAAGAWAADESWYYLCVSNDMWRRTGLASW